ncbi:hypothetical protein [Mangrovivirga cuniculi]|uniref:YD repeat-containing protein n=1 Tax=Mangrovivirga cuniculi TaxID=2715131 RepID=A0A4D7JJR0_9BACT|nr:hypothetical protein [Mangrovivirga cuniculi]QCK15213.1 hypothetical protein DCC35_10885 [Mangrovivirga cuniculi]
MNRINFILTFAILLNCKLFSQVATPTLPSNEAISLGQYGDVPTSLYNGLVNISIPLQSVENGGISVPISISYHSSGIRPDIHPSNVGLGWSLNAGGMIYRRVKGLYDEMHNTGNLKFGFEEAINYVTTLSQESWWTIEVHHSSYNPDYDLEPDEFNFSFLGYSGSFYMDHNGEMKVKSDIPLKVIYNPESKIQPEYGTRVNYPTYSEFTIINETGYRFEFGTHDATEYNDQFKYTYLVAMSWKLDKIYSPEGILLFDFNYERGPWQLTILPSWQGISQTVTSDDPYTLCNQSISPNTDNYTGSVTSPVYLKEIIMPNKDFKIDFILSPSNELRYERYFLDKVILPNADPSLAEEGPAFMKWYGQIPFFNTTEGQNYQFDHFLELAIPFKLDQINLINTKKNEIINSVKFKYNNSNTERLRLSNVELYAENLINSYTLDYYFPNLLPGYLRSFNDHWGFTNESYYTTNIRWSDLPSKKKPTLNEDLAYAGALKSISYPTGGKTTFIYEQHQYSKEVENRTNYILNLQENIKVGGLRIRQVLTEDLNGNTKTTDYYYVKTNGGLLPQAETDILNLPSSGILEVQPEYSFIGKGETIGGHDFDIIQYLFSPIIPTTPNHTSSHVTYSEIYEKHENGSITKLIYSNHDNGFKDDLPFDYYNKDLAMNPPKNSNKFKRGKLLLKTLFNSNRDSIKTELYEYSEIVNKNSSIRNYSQDAFEGLCTAYDKVAIASYIISLNYFKPSKILSFDFSQNTYDDPVINEKEISYNDLGQIVSNISRGSNQLIEEKIKYAHETIPELEELNSLSKPILIERFKDDQIINSTSYEYDYFISKSKLLYLKNISQKDLNTGENREELSVDSYDNRGNILQQTQLDGIVKSFEWDPISLKPRVIVKNAKNDHSIDETKEFLQIQGTYSFENFINEANVDITIRIRDESQVTLDENILVELSDGSNTWSGNVCYGPNCGSISSSITFTNIPAGDYTLTLRSVKSVNTSVEYNYYFKPKSLKEFYYEGFENYQGASTQYGAHTGDYSIGNEFLINWQIPNSRSYIYNYWYYENGDWKFSGDLPYNGSVTLTDYLAYDDIRIYPSDAEMTTYTYHPIYGITSHTDQNNISSFYEYDRLGRLKLIRNSNGEIVKKFDYKFRTGF